MKRTELERRLRRGGWIIESGGKHNKAVHPKKPEKIIPVPRGSNINEYTAREILKDAGLL
ncbi:MAG: type II toxin-antitoxin system HicA family toxin [Defluviitaleaceae bacterium]|nr:type II toxin-antitoxin system HicA family toxin [Defluviitaleaceae bacterium]